ncbi:MAG: TIM barrel protein [Candidatus Omnitrophica bacterium]|nr:TIM barrel protein [Candidatus Omnitrophota bacterium]
MRIGCASYSFHRTFADGRMDLLKFPATCAGLGIRELEINNIYLKSLEPDYITGIDKAVKDAGCSVACLTLDGLKLTTANAKLRNESMKKAKEYFQVANCLGATVVRIDPGHTSTDDGAQRRAVAAFKALIPSAAKCGIRIVIENHGGITQNADNMLRIIRSVRNKYFGSCPDTGNFPEEDTYTGLAKIAPFAHHVHFKTHQFTAGGEDTNKDFKKIMGIFKKAKYKGCFSIEFEGRYDENCKDDIEGVKRSLELAGRYAY